MGIKMENSLKGLMLAAGTIITCVIIGLGFYIAREAKNTAASGTAAIQKLNAEFADASKTIYEGTEVSGSEVVNAIRKFNGETIGILVSTKKADTYYGYHFNKENGELGEKSGGSYKLAQDSKNSAYINPNGRFYGDLIRDVNGVVTGILFKQL